MQSFSFVFWITSISSQQHQIKSLPSKVLFFHQFLANIPFCVPWIHMRFSDVSKEYKKLALTLIGLILVVHRKYKVLRSVLKIIDLENKPIYLRFGILNFVFSILIFRIFLIPQCRGNLVWEHVPTYSCEELGLYTILLDWL